MKLCWEVFKIKIRIKGYLKNNEERECFDIDTIAIKEKNKITYKEDDIKNTIHLNDDEIILIRENKEFKNILIFKENKDTITQYLLKENGVNLELNIKTISLIKKDNLIEIVYMVKETDNIYEYKIEMSDYL